MKSSRTILAVMLFAVATLRAQIVADGSTNAFPGPVIVGSRSEPPSEPVLIWPQFVAKAMSAMVALS